MRIAIVGALAFLLALAGSAGAVVWRARSAAGAAAPAGHGEAKGDTVVAGARVVAHAGARPDSAAADSARADTAHAATAPLPAPVPVTKHDSGPVAAKLPLPKPPVTEAIESDYKPLARILANMEPDQAGGILGHLSDAQVEGVLRSVDARRAAAILAALPEERAAALGRRLLVPAGKEK